jgi:hypothetical protein
VIGGVDEKDQDEVNEISIHDNGFLASCCNSLA